MHEKQLLEDIKDGYCCDICTVIFTGKGEAPYPHGNPATCWDCWGELSLEEQMHHKRAKIDA